MKKLLMIKLSLIMFASCGVVPDQAPVIESKTVSQIAIVPSSIIPDVRISKLNIAKVTGTKLQDDGQVNLFSVIHEGEASREVEEYEIANLKYSEILYQEVTNRRNRSIEVTEQDLSVKNLFSWSARNQYPLEHWLREKGEDLDDVSINLSLKAEMIFVNKPSGSLLEFVEIEFGLVDKVKKSFGVFGKLRLKSESLKEKNAFEIEVENVKLFYDGLKKGSNISYRLSDAQFLINERSITLKSHIEKLIKGKSRLAVESDGIMKIKYVDAGKRLRDSLENEYDDLEVSEEGKIIKMNGLESSELTVEGLSSSVSENQGMWHLAGMAKGIDGVMDSEKTYSVSYTRAKDMLKASLNSTAITSVELTGSNIKVDNLKVGDELDFEISGEKRIPVKGGTKAQPVSYCYDYQECERPGERIAFGGIVKSVEKSCQWYSNCRNNWCHIGWTINSPDTVTKLNFSDGSMPILINDAAGENEIIERLGFHNVSPVSKDGAVRFRIKITDSNQLNNGSLEIAPKRFSGAGRIPYGYNTPGDCPYNRPNFTPRGWKTSADYKGGDVNYRIKAIVKKRYRKLNE